MKSLSSTLRSLLLTSTAAMAAVALPVTAMGATAIAPEGEWLLPRSFETTKTYPTPEAARGGIDGEDTETGWMYNGGWMVLKRQGDLVYMVYGFSKEDAEKSITVKERVGWGVADEWVPMATYVNDPANAETTLATCPELRTFTAPLDAARGQDKVTFTMVAVPTASAAGIMIEAKAQDGTLLWSGFPLHMIPNENLSTGFYADAYGYLPELVADLSGTGKAGIIAAYSRPELLPGTFRLYEWDGNTFAKRDEAFFVQQTIAKGAEPTVLTRLPTNTSLACESDTSLPFVWIDQWHNREADGSFHVTLCGGTREDWYIREALIKGNPLKGDMTFVRWTGEEKRLNKE